MKTTKQKRNTKNVTPAQKAAADVAKNFSLIRGSLRELNGRVEELHKNAIGSVKDTNATIHEAAEGINQIIVMFTDLRARVEVLERVMLRGPVVAERIPPHVVN